MTAITSFRGEHFFLSNYYIRLLPCFGEEFQSGEQAFAYAKTFFADSDERDYWRPYILAAGSPGEAKRYGRKIHINVAQWDKEKVRYMQTIQTQKFKSIHMADKLLSTGYAMLVEGNDWGDKIWGRVYEDGRWVGENLLGVILMETRGRLRV